MAPYHRLDLSATYTPDKTKKLARKKQKWQDKMKKKGVDTNGMEMPLGWHSKVQGSWNFSVYNAYDRHNPFFIFFENDGDIYSGTLNVKAMQVSLFPILPSISWNFKF